jgi:6-phospho-beta-glucosidase
MKLAVIGGGSTYTPELADGLGRLAPGVSELVLVDPDEERLAAVGPVSQRIMRRHGHQATVRWTSDADDGLDGAGAVLIQLRVGGQAARNRDETWPLDFCCVGQETTGAGGLAKALRTVPLVLELADRARRRAAPGAWIIDFTNPVGIMTRALLDAGHRAVGLCNVAIGLQRYFAALLDVAPEKVTLDHVGLNHLTWERAAIVDGIDRLPELLAQHGGEVASRVDCGQSVLDELGAVPSYYLRYFYFHDEVVAEQRTAPTRAAEVMAIEQELLAMYADPALDTKPDLLARRGGAFYSEAAVALLASLLSHGVATPRTPPRSHGVATPRTPPRSHGVATPRTPPRTHGVATPRTPPRTHGGDVQVVNMRNNGTLPFLPDEAVIEGPAVIGADGPVPVPASPVPPQLRGLIAHVSAYEELAVDAAIRGGRSRVAAALLAHPLVGQYPLAQDMADRLIAENAGFLAWA